MDVRPLAQQIFQIEGDCFEFNEVDAERRLWCAVLIRIITDAQAFMERIERGEMTGYYQGTNFFFNYERKKMLDGLRSGAYETICLLAGIEFTNFREYLWGILQLKH